MLAGQLNTTRFKAERIVRTETIGALVNAQTQFYGKNGIDYVQVLATEDGRICGWCADRNGKVYKRNDIIFPLHPFDRCFLSPFKQEWLEEGLIDEAGINNFRNGAIEELRKAGKDLETGAAPFEN